MKKIVIANTIVLNGGDAAILLGQMRILREAFGDDTRFTVYAREPEAVSRYYPDLSLRRWLYPMYGRLSRMRFIGRYIIAFSRLRLYGAMWLWANRWKKAAGIFLKPDEVERIREYAESDLIVYTGGTNLVENYDLSVHIFDGNLSLIARRPVVFFTMSLGRMRNPSYRRNFKRIFGESLSVMIRGKQSAEHIKDMGADESNVFPAADAAFSLADPDVLKRARERRLPAGKRMRIAVSVRDWDYFTTVDKTAGMGRYVDAMVSAVCHLVEKHAADLTFISTCQGIPEYWKDDSRLAIEIRSKLPPRIQESVSVDREFHPPSSLIKILERFDLTISTRMHMAILSLAAGTPCLPVAYEFKTREVFERIGLDHLMVNMEEITARGLISKIDAFIATVDEKREALFLNVESERKNALNSGMIIRNEFVKRNRGNDERTRSGESPIGVNRRRR